LHFNLNFKMIKKQLLNILFSIILLIISKNVFTQNYPYDIDFYDFVNYDTNYLRFCGDSSKFEKLFCKFDTLILRGEGQIKILQIGASHTQADIFTGQVRKRFQTMDYGYNGSRGYVFPYRMMNTNNPWDYSTDYTGTWEVCRNVEMRECKLGVTGISATTNESSATVTVTLKNKDPNYKHEFNVIKVLHSTDSLSYLINLTLDTTLFSRVINFDKGYSVFILKNFLTEVSFNLEKNNDSQNYFSLYGISLETDETGIILHPIGINGASFNSYLKAELFVEQLKVFAPDLIIIAIGTNDGYTSHFDSALYHRNYASFIELINQAVPQVAIITEVPNDDYLYKKKANPATQQQEEIVDKISATYGTAVWDIYAVMGGYNSSAKWYKAGLMASDKVHFSSTGYILLGNLLFNAFLHSYEYHIDKK